MDHLTSAVPGWNLEKGRQHTTERFFLLAQFYLVLMPFWCGRGKYGLFSLGLFFNVSQRMLFLGISLCSLTLLGWLLRSPLSPFLLTPNSFLGRAFSLQALLAGQGSFRVDSVWLLCPEPISETLEILKYKCSSRDLTSSLSYQGALNSFLLFRWGYKSGTRLNGPQTSESTCQDFWNQFILVGGGMGNMQHLEMLLLKSCLLSSVLSPAVKHSWLFLTSR